MGVVVYRSRGCTMLGWVGDGGMVPPWRDAAQLQRWRIATSWRGTRSHQMRSSQLMAARIGIEKERR